MNVDSLDNLSRAVHFDSVFFRLNRFIKILDREVNFFINEYKM